MGEVKHTEDRVCCCGDYESRHTVESGHSFVDAHEHEIELLTRERDEARVERKAETRRADGFAVRAFTAEAEVERITRERDEWRADHQKLYHDLYKPTAIARDAAEAALAETRERLEKQEEHTFRIVAENDKLRELADAAEELLTVSNLRGETDYLDPIADPGLWTSRRNEAWNALEIAIADRAALMDDAKAESSHGA